ncbi:MAG TPA: hypothetical protein VFB78_02830 [Acidimicrobiales bacterium]|nr:hypothetical protein [Acidimicrobiales bacterium]
MVLFWGVLMIAIVFTVAAVVIGREARRLDAVPPNPTFNIDEAVEWVADRLPFDVSAVLSHGDVRQIIDWNLEYFRTRGVSGNGHSADVEGPVVVGGAETVDYVLHRARATGVDFTPSQVHAVLDAQMSYLEAIGAVGPEAPEDL